MTHVGVIDPTTGSVATVDAGDTSNLAGAAVSPTGPEAGDIYVPDGSGLQVINPHTLQVVDTLLAGKGVTAVAVSPTGPAAGDIYVTNATGNTVTVIQP